MQNCVITVVDTAGIQGYIFGSNRLRENVGASELVASATGAWARQALYAQGRRRTNIAADGSLTSATLEGDDLQAELIYAGGGNVLVIFTDAADAVAWVRDLSTRVLREAPGLRLMAAHSAPFVWKPDADDLAGRIGDLLRGSLARSQQVPPPSAPLLGLSVTATCQSTGLAAVAVDEFDHERVSSESYAKLNADSAAKRRFDRVFADMRRLGKEIPNDFDDLGRSKGEQSYIAVVHADGNGMGKLFQHAGAGQANRAYITTVRKLSEQVNQCGIAALQRTFGALVDPSGRIVPPFDDLKRAYLPFRPIVYGGDDVTFVCDGRLGLPLAVAYLRAFEDVTRERLGASLTAAAGVSIVKTHYPFARAYALAEELVKETKRACGRDRSALDWHIAASGLFGDLDQIREREYTVPAGKLTMRPLLLAPAANTWRTWPAFRTVLRALHDDPEWAGKNNKIQQLRTVLREGPERTNQFIRFYRLPGGRLPGYLPDPQQEPALHATWDQAWTRELEERGWRDERCGYFDAIDAQEFYMDLAGPAEVQP